MSAITGILRQPRVAGMCLAAVIFLVFWPVSDFGFISYDDEDYIVHNPHVLSGLSVGNVLWAFTTFHAQNWHPLTWLSLMLDAQVIGPDPAALHLMNVLWHITNSLLLFVILRKMTGDFGPSLFVAALFGLHPLHVESVAWISERKDVLSTCFLLLTIWAYSRYARTAESPGLARAGAAGSETRAPRVGVGPGRVYWLALGLFALGLMCKPMLVTTPFLLILLDWWPLKRVGQMPLMRLAVEKLPFFLLSGVSAVLTFLAQQQGGAVRTLEHFPFAARLGNAVVAYAAYLKKTLWPSELSIFYPHPGHWPVLDIMLAGFGLAAVSALAWSLRRRAPYVLFGWCWFLGTLLPVIGLVQVGIQARADRYTYMPLIGIFVAVAWGARSFLESRPEITRVAVPFGLALVIASAAVTRAQLKYWRSDETLFGHAIAVNPANPLAHNNLADALLREGRASEAINHYAEVIRLNPAYVHAYNNLGVALVATGRPDEALPLFDRATQLNPRFAEARLNLGDALAAKGRPREAIAQYQIVLQADSKSVPALVKLARVTATTSNAVEAIQFYERALRESPTIPAVHLELGKLLLNRGKATEALAHFAASVRLNPEDAEAHFSFGDALAKQGKRAEAAEQFRETLRLKPGHPGAMEGLRKLGV